MEGLKRIVSDSKHRKEVVAGGLAQYLDAGSPITFEPRDLTDLFGRISQTS
jgi:hypothetical protein